MKAMILAAGIGSRLKELTRDRPKCLMEIGASSTMLESVVERLKRVGVTDIMVNLHHFPEMIIDYVKEKRSFGINVSFSLEDNGLLDTGGGVKRVRSFFEHEPYFFIHNSDVYTDLDLANLLEAHTRSDAIATLPVMTRDSKRGLYFDEHNRLIGWTGEKEPLVDLASSNLMAFSGIHVVSPKIFHFMGEGEVFSIIVPYLAAARAGMKVLAYPMNDSFWMDMGTPSDLAELRKRLA